MESFPKIGNTAGGECGRVDDEFNFGHETGSIYGTFRLGFHKAIRQVGLKLGKEILLGCINWELSA